MYVKTTSAEEVNFLASSKVVSFTRQISDQGVTADAQGRKIVKAGTVYPANDGTAIGIVYTDTDVTEGPQPGAVLEEAWIIEERLPVTPSAEAKAAMKAIKFKS